MGLKYKAQMHRIPGEYDHLASIYHFVWEDPATPLVRAIHFIGFGTWEDTHPTNGPYEYCVSLKEAALLAKFYHDFPRVVRKICRLCNGSAKHPICRPMGSRSGTAPTIGYALWGVMTVTGKVYDFPWGGPWPWEQQFLA